jgi:nitrite reductase/ring-hydroxylating ferredoxin subunit
MAETEAWHPIPVPLPAPGGSRRFELAGRDLLLCNAGGTPYVIQDRCPHARFSLQGGAIEGTLLSCPVHGGQLDLRDGSPVAMPIRKPARCYALRERAGGLEVALPTEPPAG